MTDWNLGEMNLKKFLDDCRKDVDGFVRNLENFQIFNSLSKEERKMLERALDSLKECEDGNTHHEPIVQYTGKPCHDTDRPFRIIVFSQDGSCLAKAIDLFSGQYGYDHVAVDIGEIDEKTKKPLMVEAAGRTKHVERSYQDIYGDRTGYSIKLNSDVIGNDFYEKVRTMIGEDYDFKELFSFGLLNNPKKQVCADLVTRNILTRTIDQLLKWYDDGKLPYMSIINWRKFKENMTPLISPNAYARYFNAPKLSPSENQKGLHFF